jgi:alginate lyase
MRRSNYILLFGLSFMCGGVFAQRAEWSGQQTRELKELIRTNGGVKTMYDSLQRIADAALTEDPNPIDTIRSEGLLQGDPRKTVTWEALGDMHKMYALALVYRVTGKREYLDKATVYLLAWADSNVSRGDPIDDTNLDPAIEAYALVKGRLVTAENKHIVRWLRQASDAEIHAKYNLPERGTAHNNWNAHRLKVVGEIGFAIGDKALKTYCINGLKEHIGRNLLADGSSEDFVSRDALHYHIYDLEPLLKVAILLKQATGVDYYNYQAPSGSSIRKSVEWLLPYLDGRQTHAEFVNSKVDFDRKRAQNGQAEYKAGTLFQPKSGVSVLLLAAYFDQTMLDHARRLLGTDAPYPSWQVVVNEVGKK